MNISTKHPSENQSFVAKHRAAFHNTEAPTALAVGDRVWIVDHYYPGVVVRVDVHGRVLVSTPQWDCDAEAPAMRGGALVDIRLTYRPGHYRQLRVDAASAEFWPSPKGWTSVAWSGGNTLVES